MVKIKLIVIFVPLIFFLGCSTLGSKSETKRKDQKIAKTMKINKKSKNLSASIMRPTQCKLEKDIRTVSVNKTDSGCVVDYTKFDETKQIASGQNGHSHCQAIKDKVVSNLTEGGFSCSQ